MTKMRQKGLLAALCLCAGSCSRGAESGATGGGGAAVGDTGGGVGGFQNLGASYSCAAGEGAAVSCIVGRSYCQIVSGKGGAGASGGGEPTEGTKTWLCAEIPAASPCAAAPNCACICLQTGCFPSCTCSETNGFVTLSCSTL